MPDATPARIQRTIDAPAADWLTEEESQVYLRVNALVWRDMVDGGWVHGLRTLTRNVVRVPWQAVVAVQWRLLMGEVPPERPRKRRRTVPEPGSG